MRDPKNAKTRATPLTVYRGEFVALSYIQKWDQPAGDVPHLHLRMENSEPFP
jgi:hypothetical protein